MKTFLAIAVGALALVGCGPLDEAEQAAQIAQGVEQKLPEGGERGEPSTIPPPRAVPQSDQDKLYAPEAPTFLTTFIYETDIDPTAAPFNVEPLPVQ